MNAALYTRCDYDETEPVRHLEIAAGYADEHGWDLTEEFIDFGIDAETRWETRPRARQLLAHAADLRCDLDAVIVPSPHHAFGFGGLLNAVALLNHVGIELHIVGLGPVHPRTKKLTLIDREVQTRSVGFDPGCAGTVA